MALATTHKELDVWKLAMDLAMEVYRHSKTFPSDERFSLTDQIRRSSRAVPAMIAEAWRKRRYTAAFISKLNEAEAEAAETQTWAELARRSSYWPDDLVTSIDQRYEVILGQLVRMIQTAPSWCPNRPK